MAVGEAGDPGELVVGERVEREFDCRRRGMQPGEGGRRFDDGIEYGL